MPVDINGYNLSNSSGLAFGTSTTRIPSGVRAITHSFLPGFAGSATANGTYKVFPYPVNDVNFNTNGVWSPASYRFTCPVTGIYYTSYSGICGNGASGAFQGYYGIIVNGGLWYFSYRDTNNIWELHHIEMLLKLNAGDYVQWAMNTAPGPDSGTVGGAYQANHNTCTIWMIG